MYTIKFSRVRSESVWKNGYIKIVMLISLENSFFFGVWQEKWHNDDNRHSMTHFYAKKLSEKAASF